MRILICPILLVCLLSGPGRRAVAAPVPPRLVACLPVVAQGWAVEQEGDRPARIRARSLIKLGLFVAGLIAGLITFVVRLTSRPNRDSDDQFKTPVAREIRSTERLVHQHDNGSGAEAGAAVVPRSTKTGVGLAIVAALLLLMFVAIACVAILYFGLTAATQQALNELPPVKMDQFDIEFPIPVPDPNAGRVAAEHEFEKRWNVAAANVAGDDSTQPPDAQAGEKGLTESIDGPDSMATPVSWQESDVVDSGTSISHHGMSFADVAPAEALLVGLRVTGDGRCLTSIQPVYRKGIERIDGAVHGVESETHTAELSARPGEAVAAARLELSGEVFGIQLEFGKVVDGRIKLADRYVSPLFGQRVPGNAVVIEGDGDIFVGISGKVRDGFDGLSLKRVMPLANSPDETPVAWRQTRVLSPAGRGSGTAFEDMAPEDGILVGMRFFVGRSWGGAVQAVQPVYRVGSEYKLGKRCGPDGGIVRQAVARPGYAVGRIEANVGLVLNSAKLTFQRISGQSLDHTEIYESARFGSPGGGPITIDSKGRVIVGVSGSFRKDMTSIGVIVAD